MTLKPTIKIFIDFDGTISSKDVGREIFLNFGNKEIAFNILNDFQNGLISSKNCWEKLIENTYLISEQDLNKIIDDIPIDSSFHRFVDFCSREFIDIFIISDGFDFYIKRILKRENLEQIKFFSNVLRLKDGKLSAEFPYFNPDYPRFSNPKMIHIMDNSSDDDFTIYIGDGNSDTESAQYCDLIFAKDELLKFCEKNRISFYSYKNFDDIQKIIMKLLSRKRLRKSHRAYLKRKFAYEAE
jgi:2,3-diketo-5-methylthio-1-phosphopentane phosphatase